MSDPIGLFGGTFDPIHRAHLRLAQAFRDELGLAEIRLIPAGLPYHRGSGPQASPAQRLEMVRLALQGESGLCVDAREVARPRPAYTIETLEEVRAELGPTAELWFLIGGDSLTQLHTWHRWHELFDCANMAVALRPGFSLDQLPAPVREEWCTRQVTDFSKRTPSGTIRPLALTPVEMSATAIRQRLAQGQDVSAELCPAVLAYIRQHGLYRKRQD